VNKYYPPDWNPDKGSLNQYKGQHPLRERAKNLHLGILVVRFEMPFNIWCNGCGRHIAMSMDTSPLFTILKQEDDQVAEWIEAAGRRQAGGQ